MNLLCRYLVDYVTEADRQGRGAVLADHYANSSLCAENGAELVQ